MGRFQAASVATADDAHSDAARLQGGNQRGGDGGFACAACVDVAHDDHGHGQLFAFQAAGQIAGAAALGDGEKLDGERAQEQAQDGAGGLPMAF